MIAAIKGINIPKAGTPVIEEKTNDIVGEILTNDKGFWPIVFEEEWCGEFESKEQNQDSDKEYVNPLAKKYYQEPKGQTMKKVEHPEDCIRIRNVLLKLGYDLNLYEAERFWEAYSDKHSAGWLRPTQTHLKDEVKENLIILNEIPFLPRG